MAGGGGNGGFAVSATVTDHGRIGQRRNRARRRGRKHQPCWRRSRRQHGRHFDLRPVLRRHPRPVDRRLGRQRRLQWCADPAERRRRRRAQHGRQRRHRQQGRQSRRGKRRQHHDGRSRRLFRDPEGEFERHRGAEHRRWRRQRRLLPARLGLLQFRRLPDHAQDGRRQRRLGRRRRRRLRFEHGHDPDKRCIVVRHLSAVGGRRRRQRRFLRWGLAFLQRWRGYQQRRWQRRLRQ